MLQQRIQNHKRLSTYNQLVFNAVAEKEPLQDVNTITLKGEFAKKVEMLAIENLTTQGTRLTRKTVMAEMSRIFDTKTITVQEAVYRTKNGLSVVVNAPVVDENAINRVFDLVTEALDKLDGQYGVIKFGEPVSFSMNEIPWLNFH